MKQIILTTILIWSLLASSVYGQINVRDSIQSILQNEAVDAQQRFINSWLLISRNSSPSEAEDLTMHVVYPFVQQTWSNKSDQLSRLAQLYLTLSVCYRERGGDDRFEQERNCFVNAVQAAKESGNDTVYSHALFGFGLMECKRGNTIEGNKYLYQAIEAYDRMVMYTSSVEMLYIILLNFNQINDVNGMVRAVQQMEPYLKKDASKQMLYQYNVSKKMSLEALLKKAKKDEVPLNYRLVDTIMVAIRTNIGLVENFRSELDRYWQHGWAYFYLARAFYEYYPDQTDSIFHYLDKAQEIVDNDIFIKNLESYGELELKIYIYQLRAQTFYAQGDVQKAYHYMNESLKILDNFKGFKSLAEQHYIAYQFIADYYEKTKDFAQALKFQKLLRESEEERYESEKIQSLNEMSIKYETEKKELLIQKYKATQRNLWLTIGLLLMLLVISLLAILSSRLKRKNVEQQLYETALLAELRQNELEKIQNTKQQLEQNPIKNSIDRISQMVSDALIEKDTKTAYLERLSKIDIQLLENAYRTSNAKITSMDMKYIICFVADLDSKDIGLIFNIEPASVNTVRYRIKKKFSKEDSFRAIL